jgi:CheY-like chemotaxis protein
MTTTGRGGQGHAHGVDDARDSSESRLRKAEHDGSASAPRSRLLIVDDEPLVLKSCERLLGGEHSVTTASHAARALERIQRGERYDVIVCDLMMPEVSGIDFHDAVQRFDPALASRMVFITGGAFTPEMHDFLCRVPNERIDKPWNPAALRELVRRVARREA